MQPERTRRIDKIKKKMMGNLFFIIWFLLSVSLQYVISLITDLK